MKHPAHIVEQACELLSAAASNEYRPCNSDHPGCIGCIADELDDGSMFGVGQPFLLALNAYDTAKGSNAVRRYAEAEALLRTGWRPS